MRDYSTEEIIRGIARQKDRVITYVYTTCYPDIRKLILSNRGNDHDVEDIFQDGMLIMYQKITEDGETSGDDHRQVDDLPNTQDC